MQQECNATGAGSVGGSGGAYHASVFPEAQQQLRAPIPPVGTAHALQRLTVWGHGMVLWQAEGCHQLVVMRCAHAVVGSPPVLTQVVGGARDVAVAAVGLPEGLRACRQAGRWAGRQAGGRAGRRAGEEGRGGGLACWKGWQGGSF
jgi:hypothetical protein